MNSARPRLGFAARLAIVGCAGLLVGGVAAIPFSGGASTKSITVATSFPATTAVMAVPTSVGTTTSVGPATSVGPTASVGPTTVLATTIAAPTSTDDGAAPVTVSSVPQVDAKAYLVIDTATGKQLAASNADEQHPVGSIIKLLNAYVVMQAGDADKLVTVPPNVQIDPMESVIWLRPGERLARSVLLRAMLIVSANDAARTLAVDVGGSQDAFVVQMNSAAVTLGLTNTVAVNSVGLDAAGAHSSASDVAKLAITLMQDPTFRATVARPSAKLHGHTYPSTNDLLRTYRGATGVKTGHTTDAGYCVVGSAMRNGRSLVVVVLGASSNKARDASATALLDWGFAQP
ncbi:MAG: D-alanyl-D-alanine carboxypeptidase family protein [Ilumatobacteraceae bacterium]